MNNFIGAPPFLPPHAGMANAVAHLRPAVERNFPNYDSQDLFDFGHFISRLFDPESIEKKEYLQVKVLKFHGEWDTMAKSGIMGVLEST